MLLPSCLGPPLRTIGTLEGRDLALVGACSSDVRGCGNSGRYRCWGISGWARMASETVDWACAWWAEVAAWRPEGLALWGCWPR